MLCLLTILSDKLLPIRNEIVIHRQHICDACGMKCIVWDGNATRPSSWMKIKAVQESTSQCEQVLWLDADATPVKMFNFPTEKPRADIVAVHDQNGLNAGIMLFKNNTWVKKVLSIVWERTEFLHHPWWEQEALRRSIYDGTIGNRDRIRLTYDVPAHFHHIAGCFSTQPAEICRQRILHDIAASRQNGCEDIHLQTHEVDNKDVQPHIYSPPRRRRNRRRSHFGMFK